MKGNQPITLEETRHTPIEPAAPPIQLRKAFRKPSQKILVAVLREGFLNPLRMRMGVSAGSMGACLVSSRVIG